MTPCNVSKNDVAESCEFSCDDKHYVDDLIDRLEGQYDELTPVGRSQDHTGFHQRLISLFPGLGALLKTTSYSEDQSQLGTERDDAMKEAAAESRRFVADQTKISGIFYMIAFAAIVVTDELLYRQSMEITLWMAALLIPGIGRMFFGLKCATNQKRTFSLFCCSVVLGGLVWSGSVLWIINEVGSLSGASALALVVAAAICTGAVISMHPVKNLMYVHLLALSLPIAVALPITLGGTISYAITTVLLIYIVYLLIHGSAIHARYSQAQQDNVRLTTQSEQLQILADTKSVFMTQMSHEIRTPLNGIIGIAQLMRRTEIDDHHSKLLGMIDQSGEVLLGLINNILDFTELKDGNCKPQVEMSAFLQSRNVRFVFMLVVDNLRLSRVSASMDGLPLV